jgi:hypothetical protein
MRERGGERERERERERGGNDVMRTSVSGDKALRSRDLNEILLLARPAAGLILQDLLPFPGEGGREGGREGESGKRSAGTYITLTPFIAIFTTNFKRDDYYARIRRRISRDVTQGDIVKTGSNGRIGKCSATYSTRRERSRRAADSPGVVATTVCS